MWRSGADMLIRPMHVGRRPSSCQAVMSQASASSGAVTTELYSSRNLVFTNVGRGGREQRAGFGSRGNIYLPPAGVIYRAKKRALRHLITSVTRVISVPVLAIPQGFAPGSDEAGGLSFNARCSSDKPSSISFSYPTEQHFVHLNMITRYTKRTS